MPAVTPSKSYKKPLFKSFANSHTSYSVMSGSVHRPVSSRSFTMYDKVYGSSTKHQYNRISKNYTRRRITEIERCTNMEQREQYRQLIERYCKKTLAETEKLLPPYKAVSSAKENVQPPTIVIPDTPISTVFRTKPRSCPGDSGQGNNLTATSVERPFTSKFTAINHPNASKSPSFAERLDDVSNSTNQRAKKISFHSSTFDGKGTPLSSLYSSEQLRTPKTQHNKVTEWFSPPSPYLSSSFIKDLVDSYGRRERERQKKIREEETRARLLKEKREMREEYLSEFLEARLRLKPVPKVVIPELTDEQQCFVDDALIPHPQQEVICEKFNITISRQHMSTLQGLNWLNDEVINFYMELIVERSNTRDKLPKAHAMNTFFYPKLSSQGYKSVRRWTKRVDIFSKDIVFYPIHLGVHWTLAVIDFREKSITYFDSMGGSNQKCLQTLKDYLVSESEDKKKSTYDVANWKLVNKIADEIPQQLNGSDCGVFACTFAEFLGRDAALSFQQNDMPLIRRTMVWEIAKGILTR